MSNTYLTRTLGTPTLATKATCSMWFKLAEPTGQNTLFASAGNAAAFYLHTDSTLRVYNVDGSALTTNRVFRDTSAWYHLVVAIDTTQVTASNRVKVYINGIQETSFSSASYPNQNSASAFGNATAHFVGANTSPANYFNGSMSHIHLIDGTAYDASAFGSVDSDTGEWSINTSPSVTYGNNGFFILKDGNTITDSSPNSNNFSLGGGTLTKTEDCPSNVFATFNPLGLGNDVTFSNGNCTATYGTSGTRSIVTSTLGATSGKYYWEIEIQGSSSADNAVLGISLNGWETGYAVAGETNQSWGFRGYNGLVYNNNSSVGGTWSTFTNGDIIGVAVNLDDEQGGLNKLYFSKNGTWLNSANPTNHSATTGVVGITKPENGTSGFLFPVISDAGSTATPQFKTNFGNGYFGTTAVASAGTNASGIGIFEYDVPTGFTALSTKGLNL